MSRLTWHCSDLQERDAWGLGCSHSLIEKADGNQRLKYSVLGGTHTADLNGDFIWFFGGNFS